MENGRTLSVNGIDMFVTEAGDGPLVLLCHGWPELSYSWRHQLPALAKAGFHAVAPDMRGFGRTSAPASQDAYAITDLVGDMVALVAALGEKRAIVVGHDWGAQVAWSCAMFRPDLFTAVVGMSVPAVRRGREAPLKMLRDMGIETFYWQYFQEPGVAEAEFERDPDFTLRSILYGRGITPILGKGEGFLHGAKVPDDMPNWLTEADIAHYVSEYRRTGFRGGLNWYRNLDRDWALTAPWHGAQITQPALFIAGAKDVVVAQPIGAKQVAAMENVVPNLRGKHIIAGAGHWIQQQRADEVNGLLLAFLNELRR